MEIRKGSSAESFFSTEEQQRICTAVHKAEAKTSGELVPILVCESHAYPLAAARGGSLIALVLALLLTAPIGGMFWLSASNMWVFLGLFLSFFWLFNFMVKKTPPLKRFFLFADEMDVEVGNSAFAAFFEERLYKTRENNGILIYISLLEHRAWIIGDSGINDRIDTGMWNEAVQLITSGIKEKRACDSLCRAIAMIGDILEKEFPIRDDDQNELHDLIIR